MRRFEEAEIIQGLELISRTTPSRQAIEHAIERVKSSLQGAMRTEEAGPVLWQIVGRSTVVRFAAAAVLVITVLLAAVYLWHRGIIMPASRAGQVVKEVVEKKQTTEQTAAQSAAAAEAIKAELARVERGYAAKDVAGLTAMLANDNMQVRVAAANYLAMIGDINAVGALEKAGSQWQGQGENPFDAAIEAIKTADQNVPQARSKAAESADEIPHHSGPGILVHIMEKDTRKPIACVKVNAGWHYGKMDGSKNRQTNADESGFCWLDFNDGTPSFVSIWVGGAAGYVPMHVMWHEDMNKPEYFEFLLDKGTKIAGRVEDANSRPIVNAKVAVTIPAEQPRGKAYISIMDYGAQTDSEGRWGLDIIPAEAKEIQLKLSHPRYIDDSEPRKPGQGYTVEQLRAGTAVLKMERSPMILSGRITDANTGGPVTDAQVEIQGGPWRSSKTDTNGFYCFEQEGFRGNWGDFRIGIFTNEYKGITQYSERPVVHLEQDSRLVKDFKLTRACMIEMRVVDEKGRPIEQSRLTAASMASRYGSGGERFAYTDSNGMVLMGGLEPSEIEYLITATHSKRTWVEDGERAYPEETFDYAPGHLTVKLNNPEVISVGEIVLKKGVEVKGYAEYSDGVPASNVKLIAYPEWWRGSDSSDGFLVDANGYFVFSNIEPGNHRIVAKIPRGRGFLQQDVAWQILPLAERELLKVIIPEKSDRSTVSITGRARFVGGSKPDFFEIEAYSPGGVPQFGYAFFSPGFQDGNDANFVIDKLELGTYRLRFFGYGVEEKVLEDVEAPSEGLVVELMFVERPRLRGTVVDAQTRKPMEAFRARVRKVRTLRGGNYWPNESWFDISGTAGRFDIESAGPGVYQVQIAADGFAPKWSGEINTDQNTPVVVELTKGGSIVGIVADEQGRLITGAKVIPLSKAGDAGGIFINEEGAVETVDGHFELNNIAPGQETLKAIHANYGFVIERNIAVREGQVADGVRIVMRKGGTVEGYVYDTNGRGQQYIGVRFEFVGRFFHAAKGFCNHSRSHSSLSQVIRKARTDDEQGLVHIIPDCFSRRPTTCLHAPSAAPEPMS